MSYLNQDATIASSKSFCKLFTPCLCLSHKQIMLRGAKRFIPPTCRDGLLLLQFFFLAKGKNQKPKYRHYDSVIKDDMLQLVAHQYSLVCTLFIWISFLMVMQNRKDIKRNHAFFQMHEQTCHLEKPAPVSVLDPHRGQENPCVSDFP